MDILKEYKLNGVYAKHAVTNSPSDDAFPMHIHDTFEIYFFVTGEVDYLVEGASYSLHRGDLMLISPTEAHKPKIKKGTKYERYNINFPASILQILDPEKRLLQPFLGKQFGKDNLYTSAELSGLPVEQMFYDICHCEDDAYGRHLKITIFLMKLLEAVNIAYKNKNTMVHTPSNRAGEIVEYVNSHIAENISVPKLAKHFYLSTSQFNRIFKNVTGAAPWAYITAKRLIVAKSKIYSGISAHNAAAECGFNDYSVFYRAYIKHFGHAPTEDVL